MQIKRLAMGVMLAVLLGSPAISAEPGPPSRWTLSETQFASGRAELAPSAAAVLEQILARLRADPGLRVIIEGHTDDQGSRAAQLALSRKRALAVADWLIHRGVEPRRIVTKGYGGSRPVAGNATPEGRTRNRRVEIVSMAAGTPAAELAEPAGPGRNGRPALEVPEQSWAFAEVVEGTQVTHDFVVRNKGDAPLEIARVRTD